MHPCCVSNCVAAYMAQSNLPKRILKETQRLITSPDPGICALPTEDNLRHFKVVMQGSPQTCYEGGAFKLELFLPEDYPVAPPRVRFMTKVYHPNIDKLGRVYLDILCPHLRWGPHLGIRTVLLSVQQLLSYPMLEDACNHNVAYEWRDDAARAMRNAKQWTEKYASPC